MATPTTAAAASAVSDQVGDGAGERKLLVLKAGKKGAGFVEYAYLAPKHLKRQFKEVCSQSIDKQSEYWLKSFVKEFEGRAVEILELAEEFKAYLPEVVEASNAGPTAAAAASAESTATHLDEFKAHVFLERRGQTLSVVELREVMRNICADENDFTKFSFIEYLVWSYQKTLKELFEVKPYDLEPLLKGLYQAIHDYQEQKAKHDAKTEEIEDAVKKAGDEGSVVKGLVAQAALKQVLTRGATKRTRDSVYHKYKQAKAEKKFQARKKAELELKKQQEREERKAAKARMAARMAAHAESG